MQLWKKTVQTGLLCLALGACSKAPEIPILPGGSARTPVSLDGWDSQTLRSIYAQINTGGRWEALRRFFEPQSGSDLDAFLRILEVHFLNSSLDPEGLSQWLELRIHNRDFSQVNKKLHKDPSFLKLARESFNLISQNQDWVSVIERGVGWFNPSIWRAAQVGLERIEKQGLKFPIDSDKDPISPKEAVLQVQEMLGNPKTRDFVDELRRTWEISPLTSSIFSAVLSGSEDSRSKKWVDWSHHLSSYSQVSPASPGEPPPIDLLSNLLSSLNGMPEGLFSKLQEHLSNERDTLFEMARLLQPRVGQLIANRLALRLRHDPELTLDFWKQIRETPQVTTEDLAQIFRRVRETIQVFSGRVRGEGEPDYLIENLPIYLNSYVYARFIVSIVQQIKEPITSLEQVWNQTQVFSPVSISIFSKTGSGPLELNPQFRKDFEGFGLERFVQELSSTLNTQPGPSLGRWHYRLITPETEVSLAEAIESVANRIEEVRSSANLAPFLSWAFEEVSRGKPSLLERFESRNLLHSVFGFLPVQTEDWVSLKNLIHRDLQLTDPHTEVRSLVLDIYSEHPKLQKKVSSLFDALRLLVLADSPDYEGQFTLFNLSQTILGYLGPHQYSAFIAPFDFLAKTGWLGSASVPATGPEIVPETVPETLNVEQWRPAYPIVYHFLQSPRLWAHAFSALAQIEEEFPGVWATYFGRSLSGQGTLLHWDFAKRVADQHPSILEWAWEQFEKPASKPEETNPFYLTPMEFRWFSKLVESGALGQVRAFLWNRLTRDELHRWIQEIKAPENHRHVEDFFSSLGSFSDPRLSRTVKLVLEMIRSGEWAALLESLELIIDP